MLKMLKLYAGCETSGTIGSRFFLRCVASEFLSCEEDEDLDKK